MDVLKVRKIIAGNYVSDWMKNESKAKGFRLKMISELGATFKLQVSPVYRTAV